MKKFELVIVGGGLASARAVKAFREAGGEGSIALISRDSTLPYHRPPLSKKFLRGETDDEPLTLRTVADSKAIREAASSAERVVVVGAGFIGMEVAASLRTIGRQVTQVHLGRWLFDDLGVEQLSDELAALYTSKGVELVLGNEVASFLGNGALEAVTTKNGREIEADVAVVGIGVEPVTAFLADSGIELENGIVVNQRFETNVPNVYAAGDVANFFDPVFQKQRRIEHWSNANYQGTEVGKVLAGIGEGYDRISEFFTEVFGVTIKVFGEAPRDASVVVHGSLRENDLYALYGDASEEVIGALSVGQSEEVEELLKRQIKARAPLREVV